MHHPLFSACLVWSIMAIAPLLSNAQEAYSKKDQLMLPPGTNETIANAITRKEIDIKAVRDFIKNFPTTSEIWYKLKDGYMARFSQADVLYKIYYNTGGKRVCILQLYKEERLPLDILLLIKPSYWDFTIYNVAQVDYIDKKVYLVYLRNKAMFKTLRIYNNEIEVIQEFVNASAN